MKKYQSPEAEVVMFETLDVVSTSGAAEDPSPEPTMVEEPVVSEAPAPSVPPEFP